MLVNNLDGAGLLDDNSQLFITRKKEAQRADKEKLLHDIERAVMLGNLYNEPALVYYLDREGISHQKEEIVQAVTTRYLILMKGESLPLGRVKQVIV